MRVGSNCTVCPHTPVRNAIEDVWKTTRRRAAYNRYFDTPAERDAALIETFLSFHRRAQLA
jgi:transposase